MRVASEYGFAFYVAQQTVLRGWVLAEQGQVEAGLAQMRQGVTAYQATGAEAERTYLLGLLAAACGKVGQTQEGLGVLDEALSAAQKHALHVWEGELYRVKGELLLGQAVIGSRARYTAAASSLMAEAETCFHHALELTRRLQAKSLELRAAMSLSRLWQHQGKRGEARELLAPVYDWFTEGFDTADLQEAKALLEELGTAG